MWTTAFSAFDDWDSPDGYVELLTLPCFFAVVPDTDPAEVIKRIGASHAAALGLDWNRFGQRNPHLSLCAIEKLSRVRGPPKVVLDAAATVKFDAFDAVFDCVETFGNGSYPTVLRGDTQTDQHMRLLAKSIEEAMYKIGIKAGSVVNGKPHITVFYDPSHRSISGPITPVRWRVREFVLIRSHVGYATHETVGHWSLENQ